MNLTCFRDELESFEAAGEVQRFTREVDPVHQVAAIAKKLDPGPVLFFEKVRGSDLPIVVGMDGTRDRVAQALGTTRIGILDKYAEALENPVAAVEVQDAPVQEVVRLGDDVDLTTQVPIMTHYEEDGGPYITTGLVVAEDRERGIRNVSYHRMQLIGPRELRILLLPRHVDQLFSMAEAEGRELSIAVVIGADTAQRLAAATWGAGIPLGMDEFSISGGLKGHPEELVKCVSSDVRVPARAELIIEGAILPGRRESEGPFAEFTGNYGPTTMSPVVRVDALTRRSDAIYQGFVAFSGEHQILQGLPNEPVILQGVRKVVPETSAVHVTPGGCGKFHAVIQLKKSRETTGRDAILAAFAAMRDVKMVTVVDEDVDPFDSRDVEWAVATRFQADKDLIVVPRTWGNLLDPSTYGTQISTKMGLDATRPLEAGRSFVKAVVPGADSIVPEDFF